MQIIITPEQKAARIEAALKRHAHIPALIDAIEHYRRCDMDHTRTQRASDYECQLLAEYELATVVEALTGWCLDNEREQIADELRSECAFDVNENAYLNDDGEPILPGQPHRPRGYADYIYDMRRDDASIRSTYGMRVGA